MRLRMCNITNVMKVLVLVRRARLRQYRQQRQVPYHSHPNWLPYLWHLTILQVPIHTHMIWGLLPANVSGSIGTTQQRKEVANAASQILISAHLLPDSNKRNTTDSAIKAYSHTRISSKNNNTLAPGSATHHLNMQCTILHLNWKQMSHSLGSRNIRTWNALLKQFQVMKTVQSNERPWFSYYNSVMQTVELMRY